jgi:hypothetical protein
MILEKGEKVKKKKQSARYRCDIGTVTITHCRGTEEVNVMKWFRVKTKCRLL